MRASTEWLYRDPAGIIHEINDQNRRRGCDPWRWDHGVLRDRAAKFPTCLWCAADRP